MRSIILSALVVLVIVGLDGCFTQPTYPIVPQISFSSICYGKSAARQDSIYVELNFKDGDGDIGLNDLDTLSDTYARKFNYLFQNKLVTYKTKRLNPQLTINGKTLPNFVSPFNCTNWEVEIDKKTRQPIDTLYVEYNPNYYNIVVDFYIDDGTNNFVKYDFAANFKYPGCFINGFNGRVPILSSDLGKKSPLDGKLRYAMRSLAFDVILSNRRFKLEITIQDRALNKSNTVLTDVYTLAGIRCR
jgi:hypothetical protein